jgi:CRISPR-associated exonuclease Cas4
VPELAIWGTGEGYLLAGRADALAIRNGRVEVAIDWKSDVNPTAMVQSAYAAQLRDYLTATGAPRGMLVFLTPGEIMSIDS